MDSHWKVTRVFYRVPLSAQSNADRINHSAASTGYSKAAVMSDLSGRVGRPLKPKVPRLP